MGRGTNKRRKGERTARFCKGGKNAKTQYREGALVAKVCVGKRGAHRRKRERNGKGRGGLDDAYLNGRVNSNHIAWVKPIKERRRKEKKKKKGRGGKGRKKVNRKWTGPLSTASRARGGKDGRRTTARPRPWGGGEWRLSRGREKSPRLVV